jgi:ATP-binding cassette subfamily B multidrug efflux pump
MMALGGALLVGLVGVGTVLWRTDAAPLGLVAAALALSFRITAMAEWLLDAVSSLFGAVGALRRALRTVAQPLAVADRPGAAALRVRGGAISFRGVSHHYGRGEGGLDRLDLDVAAGERVGVAGRIVEQGTHAQLVERDGLSAQLWSHQSGGFLGTTIPAP